MRSGKEDSIARVNGHASEHGSCSTCPCDVISSEFRKAQALQSTLQYREGSVYHKCLSGAATLIMVWNGYEHEHEQLALDSLEGLTDH
jgi:hypothetical protein